MKKLLTGLMLATASLTLLFTANNVFAVEYDDLFYETIDIEFEVLTWDSNTGKGTVTPGTVDLLSSLITFNNDTFTLANNIINFKINNVDFTDEYTISNNDNEIQIWAIDLMDSEFLNTGDIILVNGGFIDFEVGDLYVITVKNNLTWTQAHDYGRIRLEDTTRNMYLNKVDNEVFLSTTSPDYPNPENHKAFLDQPYENDKNFEIGTKVTLQSPYENFKIIHGSAGQNVIVQKDNVSAVYLEKVAQPTSTERIYDITVFYWEDEELLSQVVEDVDLFGLVNLRIMFYGGIRKAIDYQDLMVANVDELTPLEDFLPYLTAFDAIDGDISDEIVIVNDGGYQPDVVDIYNVEFGVTNSNGLESTVILPVHVVDIVAPVITGVDTPVNISYDQSFNVTSWVNSLSVTDNYYTGLSISILNNSYSSNKTEVGTYEITVQAVDPSGNKGTLTRVINVTDGVGPVFSGIDTITASINENLTVEQIKAGLAAIDAIDGNVTASITVDSDNLTGNSSIPGTYEVIFMAVDSVENQTFHTVDVTIVTSPPGFYILNSNSIRLLPGASLSIEQILNLLGAVGASEVSTNYNADVPGTYNLSFSLNGETVSISITVLGQNQSPIPTPEVPGTNVNTNINIYLTIIIAAVAVSAIAYVIYKKKKSV